MKVKAKVEEGLGPGACANLARQAMRMECGLRFAEYQLRAETRNSTGLKAVPRVLVVGGLGTAANVAKHYTSEPITGMLLKPIGTAAKRLEKEVLAGRKNITPKKAVELHAKVEKVINQMKKIWDHVDRECRR